jgi:probable phosphoglycerate mutase
VEVLVSSDLPRALQTAEPIGAALGLRVHQDAAWRERYYGSLEGKNADERTLLRLRSGIEDGLPPDIQRAEDYRRLVLQALHYLPARYPAARCIAIVTHAGAVQAIATAVATADGVSNTEANRACPNCSITRLTVVRHRGQTVFRLDKAYDVEHLDTGATTSSDSG